MMIKVKIKRERKQKMTIRQYEDDMKINIKTKKRTNASPLSRDNFPEEKKYKNKNKIKTSALV